MSELSTAPPAWHIGTTEMLPLGVDMAALLLEGESISDPTAVLLDPDDGSEVAAGVGAPSVAGTVITQTLTGAELVAGAAYRLVVSFTAGGKRWSTETLVRVVF